MRTGMWLWGALLPLLAGCNTDTHSAAVAEPKSQVVAGSSAPLQHGTYPERMRRAITQEMPTPGKYKSQTCSISIHLFPDGSLKNFKVLEGDAELCAAASQAVQRAKLPKMTSQTEYALFNSSVLDFVP
ncbi:cell envelope integrity TolA C-terminal domain-containing protein [Serratia liquefaciens]|uniref:cell envelope integrity TolA C-terminal domain-containing protein n=1 Tax=Serratia liquefaciens TaxID=614 RepID=UPI00218310EC|nr:cell envelope integrity TolA C-terminal domain-containing protein [Serratia liquefaciens]CAI2440280.1 cell envelope integrity inner membrane protein TolA [Serratia liquefaciens]